MNSDGAYSLLYPHSDIGLYDLSAPVEGLRDGWQGRMIANGQALSDDRLKGFVYALSILALSEALPPAFGRSLPIYRLQIQLAHVLQALEI